MNSKYCICPLSLIKAGFILLTVKQVLIVTLSLLQFLEGNKVKNMTWAVLFASIGQVRLKEFFLYPHTTSTGKYLAHCPVEWKHKKYVIQI